MKLFFTSIIYFFIIFCSAQIKLSEELQKDITHICSICKENSNQFNEYHKDHFHLAHFFYNKKKIDSSFFYIANMLTKKENLIKEKIYVLHYLKGLILKRKALYNASISSFNKALLTTGKNNSIASLNNVYIHLSKNYLYQKKFDSAIVILEDWKKKNINSQITFDTSKNFHNLGINYLHLENYKKAEENLLKSHRLNILSKNTIDLAYSSVDLANLYYEQYKDSLAILYFKKGLTYAKKSNDLAILQNAYQNMAIVKEGNKEFQKALFFRKKYEKIKDSIWNRDKIWKLAQTDKTIAAVINNQKLQTAQNKTNLAILFASTLLLFLLIVIFAMYKINKQRKLIYKQNQNLEDLHKLKDDLFAILGHDLRAPMHHILHLNKQMHTASKQIKDTVLYKLIDKNAVASNKMHLILDNILHWILLKNKQGYFEKEIINVSYLIKLVLFDFEALLSDKSIKATIDINDTLVLFADINSVKVILRNVLDNAIKFTPENGCITIKANTENNITTINISDNGIGMETNNSHFTTSTDTNGRKSTGLGLKLCQSFIKRNNGNFKIKSKKGSGTTVIISFPNIKK